MWSFANITFYCKYRIRSSFLEPSDWKVSLQQPSDAGKSGEHKISRNAMFANRIESTFGRGLKCDWKQSLHLRTEFQSFFCRNDVPLRVRPGGWGLPLKNYLKSIQRYCLNWFQCATCVSKRELLPSFVACGIKWDIYPVNKDVILMC